MAWKREREARKETGFIWWEDLNVILEGAGGGHEGSSREEALPASAQRTQAGI